MQSNVVIPSLTQEQIDAAMREAKQKLNFVNVHISVSASRGTIDVVLMGKEHGKGRNTSCYQSRMTTKRSWRNVLSAIRREHAMFNDSAELPKFFVSVTA